MPVSCILVNTRRHGSFEFFVNLLGEKCNLIVLICVLLAIGEHFLCLFIIFLLMRSASVVYFILLYCSMLYFIFYLKTNYWLVTLKQCLVFRHYPSTQREYILFSKDNYCSTIESVFLAIPISLVLIVLMSQWKTLWFSYRKKFGWGGGGRDIEKWFQLFSNFLCH